MKSLIRTIRTDKICKIYNGRKVVNNVSISVSQGEIVGLLGPNGAGKTTSFYMIVGMVRPDSGHIFLDDVEMTEKPMFRRSIAFQRCVIPATGFYEWDAAKHKYFFQMPGQPIYLAGIYDNISGVNCFIILTTAPNDSVAPIHDRMPLLLSHEQVRPWLVDAGAALELLCSRPPLLQRTSCDGQLGFDDLA